jgi:lipopolysaccharide export system protein LptA
MYKPNFIQSLSFVLTLGAAANSFAAQQSPTTAEGGPAQLEQGSTISTDFGLPVTLDSKSQSLDGKNKTSIFTDNVVIRQGSLELLADQVEVNAADGAGKEIIIATGQPASYKQRKDDGSLVAASANQIIYMIESRTIALKGAALIMQNEVKVTGDSIVFDMTKEQILASTDDNSSDSVRTVISPGAFSSEDQPLPNDPSNQKDNP